MSKQKNDPYPKNRTCTIGRNSFEVIVIDIYEYFDWMQEVYMYRLYKTLKKKTMNNNIQQLLNNDKILRAK